MELNQPFYIDKRQNSISLNGKWEYTYLDTPSDLVDDLDWKYDTQIPSSIYFSLYNSGVLKHPYVDLNNKDYYWVDEKVWYYKKEFDVSEDFNKKDAFLCFEGVAYYSRVWFNGCLLGSHEGMFGGPVVNVCDKIKKGKNVIIVEVIACTYGKKDTWKPRNDYGENREIVPWDLARNEVTNNQDFIVVGIWNDVRLEIVPKIHMSRPYLETVTVSEKKADLRFDVEISSEDIDELKSQLNIKRNWHEMNYVKGLNAEFYDESVEIEIKIKEKVSGKEVYCKKEDVKLLDIISSVKEPMYRQCQFYSTDISIENPRLWYPAGIGEAFLYTVEAKLSMGGKSLDNLSFNYGIKTFELDYTTGMRFRNMWGKFRFIVNGEPFFLKGMNYFQQDMLLKIDKDDYRWTLELVKEEGIQLIRIWSGGGIPELDILYDICDELGILVWQDHPIANQQTPNWPQEVLEAHMAMNVFRIRNHPSLAMHCGGNEFNPYALGNAASMFIIERTLSELDPKRPFVRTTPDKGSAHVYTDFEPSWYRLLYKQLPFLAESGIHCFPNVSTFKQVIGTDKLPDIMPDVTNEKWCEDYPEVMNHFIEYDQTRMDRICARASHINYIDNISFEDFVEAVQFSCCDFYQIMIESMRENYPVTGGIMPWAFKRPWPNIGVMLVDGLGKPVPAYYYVKNAYKKQMAILCLDYMMYAPNEYLPLKTAVLNDDENAFDAKVKVTVYNTDFTIAYEKIKPVNLKDGEYKQYVTFDNFNISDEFSNKFIIVKTELIENDKIVSRNLYWIKCLEMLKDKEINALYRENPQTNMNFDKEDMPHLKLQVSKTVASLSCSDKKIEYKDARCVVSVKIKNTSGTPVFPVYADVESNDLFYLNDNYFMLDIGEEKELKITFRISKDNKIPKISIKGWNLEKEVKLI